MKKLFKKHKTKLFLILIIFLGLGYVVQQTLSRNNDFEFRTAAGNAALSPTPELTPAPSPSPESRSNWPLSPITGASCENAMRRPVAVMLATDRETRPLSGISEADMVFEMPVVTDSITRLMAVYGCSAPKEIGSVRSARHNFIDLASAVGAVYAHWGGSHFALDRLKTGIIDNLDALSNLYETFYRKNGIPDPHNGFTSGERLANSIQKLGFNPENKFTGYPHETINSSRLAANSKTQRLVIGYPGEFRIEYQYDPASNSYLRWRGGIKEIDKNNSVHVSVKNIAVMYTVSKQIEGQYNNVRVDGHGKAEFYLNGGKTEGIWKKADEPVSSKLYFLDNSGNEIKFTPGNIWVEVVQTNQKTEWTSQ